MEKKCTKHIALVLYLFCVSVIVFSVLGVSLARYFTSINGITGFNIAGFNALILGENELEDFADVEQLSPFAENWDTSNLYPGMVPEAFDFIVSNGSSEDDVSDVNIKYSVVLRTTGNLPLKYRLGINMGDTDEDGEDDYVFFVTGQQRTFERSEGDSGNFIIWYEYSFFPENSTEESEFAISGNSLAINKHRLEISWPIEGEGANRTNQAKYMKEVDMVELLFNISSAAGNTSTSVVVPIDDPRTYNAGVVSIIPQNTEQTEGSFGYKINFAGFRGIERIVDESTIEEYVHEFQVNNGKNVGGEITRNYYYYTIKLKEPMFAYNVNSDSDADISALHYTLRMQDLFDLNGNYDTGEYITLDEYQVEYRLYDELYGSTYGEYTVLDAEDDAEALEDYNGRDENFRNRYKLYRIVSFAWNDDCIYGMKLSDIVGTSGTDEPGTDEPGTDEPAESVGNPNEAVMKLENRNSTAMGVSDQFFKNKYQIVLTRDGDIITDGYLKTISYNAYPVVLAEAFFPEDEQQEDDTDEGTEDNTEDDIEDNTEDDTEDNTEENTEENS